MPSADDSEAYLELDDAAPPPSVLNLDTLSTVKPPADDEAFLEIDATPAASNAEIIARSQVISDDDLSVVTALGDDSVPLVVALWPSRFDMVSRFPSEAAVDERVAFARRVFNQVTRRGAEWRARADVASSALERRLSALGSAPRGERVRAEFDRWDEARLDALLRREVGAEQTLYALESSRVLNEAKKHGWSDDAVRARCEALGFTWAPAVSTAWAQCEALPGAPSTLDAAATALLTAPAQCLAAMREGAVSAWLLGHRAPEALVTVARTAEALAREESAADEGLSPRARVALGSLAWALGHEGVVIDGLVVTTAETLKSHLRTGRVRDVSLREHAALLGQWFQRRGEPSLAAACEALGGDDPVAPHALRWALGEPLRLGQRAVADPAQFAREALQRPAAREDALRLWRDKTLAAWLDTLPRQRRDALWLDELRRHPNAPSAFWRGLYRRAPRAPLRLHLGEAFGHRSARFDTLADLQTPSRVAAVWPWLREALAAGELDAWLTVAAPGIERSPAAAADDLALHETLWSVGFTAMVLPWGRAALAVSTLSDLVSAWRKSPSALEAALGPGIVAAWLRRFHPSAGVPGVELRSALETWGDSLGYGTLPEGTAGLRVALLAGLEELPIDPAPGAARSAIGSHGMVGLDAAQHAPEAWQPLLRPDGPHRLSGTVFLWAARHAPALGFLASRWLRGEPLDAAAVLDELCKAGVPRASEALAEALRTEGQLRDQERQRRALEEEATRLALERERARLAREREGAEAAQRREALTRKSEREALRREVARDLARLTAERDLAQATLSRAEAEVEARDAQALAQFARERASWAAAQSALRQSLEAQIEQLTRRLAVVETERDEALLRAAEAERIARIPVAIEAPRTVFEPLDAPEAPTEQVTLTEAEAALIEAERRAQEAAARATSRGAEALALEARHTEAHDDAQREAAEAARRLTEALQALDASDQADDARRLGEIEALSAQAEAARREAEALAETLSAAQRRLSSRDSAPDDEALMAALEGMLEHESEALPEVELDEGLALPERHDTHPDLLAEAYTLTDDASLGALRAAMTAWAEARPRHPLVGFARTLDDLTVTLVPCFEVYVATRLETREVVIREGTLRIDDDPVLVPPEAVEGEQIDPWALPLNDVDVWDRWEADVPLDHAIASHDCPDCKVEGHPFAAGVVACKTCHGEGSVACRACNAWGRVKCHHCSGNGVVPQGDASVRCRDCEGRKTLPCTACAMGREGCPSCKGEKTAPCQTCGADGEIERFALVRQSFLGVSARGVVGAEGVPAEVVEAVHGVGAEPLPVVHWEAPELDPAALPNELPHPALAAAASELLTAEAARGGGASRVARQRLVIRRYPVWRVRYTHEGAAYEAWLHGTRKTVYAPHSPLSAWLDARVNAARSAVSAEALGDAVNALEALVDVAPEHPGARDVAGALGRAVLAMAVRGELFAAREAADAAAVLRYPECVTPLVEAERLLARRLNSQRSWAVAEEASVALERNHLARCAERLTALHALEAEHPDGLRIAAALGLRWKTEIDTLLATAQPEAALGIVIQAEAVPFVRCREALGPVGPIARQAAWRARARRWLPSLALIVGALVVVLIAVRLATR
ncbi:MAG: hypothetical protein JNK72_19570 [Myxococcales bacterium]|nr:hypothetical protein [Myxococcales bacterium]